MDDVVLVDVDASAAVEPERRGACTLADALPSVLPSMPCARLGISDGMANWQLYAAVISSTNNYAIFKRSIIKIKSTVAIELPRKVGSKPRMADAECGFAPATAA